MLRQKWGSLVCPSCGTLVGVNDQRCLTCGRWNPGMWGFAPILRQLGADLGFVPLVITGSVVLYVLSLVASNGELAPWTVTYALWRWWRSPKLYIPGANPVPGYHVRETQELQLSPRSGGGASALAQLEELL